MKRKIVPISALSVGLGLLFDILIYGKIPGVSILLYTGAAIGTLYYLASRFGTKLNKSVWFLTPVVLFFAGMIFVRASGPLVFLNMIAVTYLLLLIAKLSINPSLSLQEFGISKYFRSAGIVFGFPAECYRALSKWAASSQPKNKPAGSIIRGVALSIPVLIVFGILLSSADLVFKRVLGSLFDFGLTAETGFRLFLVAAVSGMFIGAFAKIFMASKKKQSDTSANNIQLGATEALIVTGSVAGMFLLFVLIQLTYLFGGSHNVVAGGYTYAEYARKGFFELIAVAFIAMVLVWIIKRATAHHASRFRQYFKWLGLGLTAEVMIIIGSAHMRLALYEHAYGFTLLRLFSHLIIGWLAVVFVLLAIHIVSGDPDNRFAFRLFLSGLAAIAVFNLINPDALTARQNISRLQDTGKIDIKYLGQLSADAVPETGRLLDDPNKQIRNATSTILYRKKHQLDREYSHWQSANISVNQAQTYLDSKQTQLHTN